MDRNDLLKLGGEVLLALKKDDEENNGNKFGLQAVRHESSQSKRKFKKRNKRCNAKGKQQRTNELTGKMNLKKIKIHLFYQAV